MSTSSMRNTTFLTCDLTEEGIREYWNGYRAHWASRGKELSEEPPSVEMRAMQEWARSLIREELERRPPRYEIQRMIIHPANYAQLCEPPRGIPKYQKVPSISPISLVPASREKPSRRTRR